MKLSEAQKDALRKFLEPLVYATFEDLDDVLADVLKIVEHEEPAADDDAYKRFMAEWKLVGVWAGGKPVRAKLARLAKAGQLPEVWAGLERLRNDPNRPDPQYIPRPMTWLNQERWNDDPYPPKSGGRQAAAGAVLGIDLGQPAALPESTPLAVSRGELHQSLTNPLATRCPVCNASPGERCSGPTNSGRVAVSGVHPMRQARA